MEAFVYRFFLLLLFFSSLSGTRLAFACSNGKIQLIHFDATKELSQVSAGLDFQASLML